MKMHKERGCPFKLLAGFPPPEALWEDGMGLLEAARCWTGDLQRSLPACVLLQILELNGLRGAAACSHQDWCWDVSFCLNDFTPGSSLLPSLLLCPQLGHSSSKAELWEVLLLPKSFPLCLIPSPLPTLGLSLPVLFQLHYSLPEHTQVGY